MKQNKSDELKARTKEFAFRCYEVGNALWKQPINRDFAKQLIRSSSSIAANYRAACLAQSKAAFAAKISIVLEEADESLFWLEFILELKLLDRALQPLITEADELVRIFKSSRITARKNQK